ncbi:hypothetical protein GcC1_039018 [Golovinomyces cichoracearum]|uniref:AHC1-like C2H2 zinc-finger domain-containing protein n=1 Tax=Golovinomyces cichoracearum TaxID=62708 RepID=A0A420J019_9PEZI|nr:hypothetical protein GcC1_039018 [Golovinomyces cichoracearum]
MLIRISPWDCDQIIDGHTETDMANATHSVAENFSGTAVKRKRSLSDETTFNLNYGLLDLKRRKDLTALRSPISPLQTKLEEEPENVMDPSLIANTIESQFSLEILLKHNELRLIDQELAKCQIALEQLRRCHLIPYPITLDTPEAKLKVSDGTGPALCQDKRNIPWAPPFGVTDGPYTRHYARWLIPDPSFDGVAWKEASQSRSGENFTHGRATRHRSTETATKIGKIGLRGVTSQKLHALSNGYPQAKDKVGPCVLKRGDGQTVKLVCLDCHRENFSSTQGFINHCRISHRRDFKSHEEAANASGQPVNTDGAGSILGDNKSSVTSNSLVHPLIRNAPTGKEAKDACRALLARVADSKAMLREGRLPGFQSIPKSTCSNIDTLSTSTTSSLTPHLSELLQHKGFPGKVDEIVNEVQQKLELDEFLEEQPDDPVNSADTNLQDHNTPESPSSSFSSLTQMRMPARVGAPPGLFQRSENSKKIADKGVKRKLIEEPACFTTPCDVSMNENPKTPKQKFTTPDTQNDGVERHINESFISDLSPQTGISNNAPSLVSDDGEYDEDGIESTKTEDEDDQSDVAEIGTEEESGQTVLRNCTGGQSMSRRTKTLF